MLKLSSDTVFQVQQLKPAVHLVRAETPSLDLGYHLISCRVFDPHGHAKSTIVPFAVDVVQVRLRVSEYAVAHTAVVASL